MAPELRGLPFEDLPLGPMPLERLPRVITGPAARVALELEDGLVERLVAGTGSGDALPLLAFTLRQLWERRQGDQLTIDLYERELGSIEGAVAAIAEGIAPADVGLGGGEGVACRLHPDGPPRRRGTPGPPEWHGTRCRSGPGRYSSASSTSACWYPTPWMACATSKSPTRRCSELGAV